MPTFAPAALIDAIAFAAHKHRNQRRKNVEASPYINHPIALAHVLAIEAKVHDEQVLIAAMLHDTLEDTETSFEELRERLAYLLQRRWPKSLMTIASQTKAEGVAD